jgi:hypothetical protein
MIDQDDNRSCLPPYPPWADALHEAPYPIDAG